LKKKKKNTKAIQKTLKRREENFKTPLKKIVGAIKKWVGVSKELNISGQP